QQFVVPFPESTRDPPESFSGSSSVVFGIRAGPRRFRSQEVGLRPGSTVVTGREFHSLTDAIFYPRSVAPHDPEPVLMMNHVIVLIDTAVRLVNDGWIASRHADTVNNDVFAAKVRQLYEVDCVRIGRNPATSQHRRRGLSSFMVYDLSLRNEG